LVNGATPSFLFPNPPIIHLVPEFQACPSCKTRLHVLKTSVKTVVTLDIGAFRAKATELFCPNDQKVFISEQLRRLTPAGCVFGYDVMVEVGLALFIRCRNNQEIMDELAARNVYVSEREISYLGSKFIIYLSLSHRDSQEYLREMMGRNGGYILHVDGTCEGNSPNLFCGIDGISELVLDAIKIPSEKKDQLIPFFQRIKQQYGKPRALVHDMGKGILAAIEEVFAGLPDFICHFHFLRDIGKDLLLDEYTAMTKRLRKLKVRPTLRQKAKYFESKISFTPEMVDKVTASLESGTWQTASFEHIPLITAYVLIQWVFDYPRQSNGYGFPFDRPQLDFYRRLQTAHLLLGEIMDVHLRSIVGDNRPFVQIHKALKEAVEDKRLNALATTLERKAEVFDKLRTAMRLALPESKNGLNDNGDDAEIKTIEENVIAFRTWLIGGKRRTSTYAKMLTQLDKYWEKLFADPLPVVTADGLVYIQPQRTNNLLERFFRAEKQRSRKKSGTASLNKVLKATLAKTPLVQNLNNHEYYKIILNGCPDLARRFSQIDEHLVQKEMKSAKKNTEKIMPVIRKVIKGSGLTTKISALFSE